MKLKQYENVLNHLSTFELFTKEIQVTLMEINHCNM